MLIISNLTNLMCSSFSSTLSTCICSHIGLYESSIYTEWIFKCLDTINIEVWLEHEATESLSQSCSDYIDILTNLLLKSSYRLFNCRNLFIENSCKLIVKSSVLILCSETIMSSLKLTNGCLKSCYFTSHTIDFGLKISLESAHSAVKLSLKSCNFSLCLIKGFSVA